MNLSNHFDESLYHLIYHHGMKSLLYILPFLLPSSLFSQGDAIAPSTFLVTSVGVGNMAASDEMMSPLAYKGWVYGPQLGLEKLGGKSLFRVNLHYSFGKLSTSAYPERSQFRANSHFGEISIGYLRRLRNGELAKWNGFLGGSWNSMINVRDHPWLYVYGESSTGLAAELEARRQFEIGNNAFELAYGATLPLVNMVVVPGYAYSPPEPFMEQNAYYAEGKFKRALQSLEPAMFWDFFRFQNSISISKQLKGCNRIFLAYDFTFISYNEHRKTSVGRSFLRMGLKTCF